MLDRFKEGFRGGSGISRARQGKRIGDVFVQVPIQRKLRRVLGVPGLFSAAYGDVGSSIYYALGVVAMSALGLTPPVLMVSGILFLFTALSYAEGATALPEAGGSGAFALRAFGGWISFVASWALMMDYIVTMSISAFTAANYFGYFFPILKSWPVNSIAGVVVIAGLAFVNIRGIQRSARLNIVLVLVDIVTQLSIVVIGIVLIISLPQLIKNIHWGTAPTTSQLLFGISISMVAYTGIETLANLGGETRDPGKSIPRAVLLVFAAVIILYAFLSMTALSAYPVYQGADGAWVTDLTQKYLEDPIMGIAYAMPALIRPIISVWVAVLAVTILVIATNAGMLGTSRLAYFMGMRKQLPSALSRVSSRSRVPQNAIIMFSVIASILIATGRVTILVDIYAFGAMLAYTAAHASIIALRIKEPDLPRPFKIPLNIRIRQREIPITAVIGGLATLITWFIVVYTHHFGRIVGFAWLIIGLIIYALYRRSMRKSKVNSNSTEMRT
jgi:APA family basic amino acid/polyamine antiporter